MSAVEHLVLGSEHPSLEIITDKSFSISNHESRLILQMHLDGKPSCDVLTLRSVRYFQIEISHEVSGRLHTTITCIRPMEEKCIVALGSDWSNEGMDAPSSILWFLLGRKPSRSVFRVVRALVDFSRLDLGPEQSMSLGHVQLLLSYASLTISDGGCAIDTERLIIHSVPPTDMLYHDLTVTCRDKPSCAIYSITMAESTLMAFVLTVVTILAMVLAIRSLMWVWRVLESIIGSFAMSLATAVVLGVSFRLLTVILNTLSLIIVFGLSLWVLMKMTVSNN